MRNRSFVTEYILKLKYIEIEDIMHIFRVMYIELNFLCEMQLIFFWFFYRSTENA